MKRIVLGILAHVDAGKTTLSEALLYTSGAIRKFGRVDKQDAFLDNYILERKRGITIFSKEAEFSFGETDFTLLDTPGHKDFSAEMKRTLGVLDVAILVVNGNDEINLQTVVLERLLEELNIPTFIFVNKMDIAKKEKVDISYELKDAFADSTENIITLKNNLVDFSDFDLNNSVFLEELAGASEVLTEKYLKDIAITIDDVIESIEKRDVVPIYFGSALKLQGVNEFLLALDKFTRENPYNETFEGVVYKISRDIRSERQSHLKITGGSIKVKDVVNTGKREEKVNQIRKYNGEKFETVKEAFAGEIVAITGFEDTFAGEVLKKDTLDTKSDVDNGNGYIVDINNYYDDENQYKTYILALPEGANIFNSLQKLEELNEEDPNLNITWDENLREIHIDIAGNIQMDILETLILDRFGLEVSFSEYIPMEEVEDEEVEDFEEEELGVNLNEAKAINIGDSDKDLDRIFKSVYGEKKDKTYKHKEIIRSKGENDIVEKTQVKDEYLIVDGYNILFAWEELKALSKVSIDGARDALLEILSNYQGYKGNRIIVVFDAYKVKRGLQTEEKFDNIDVVYTKEAESADAYIERITHEIGKKYYVRVATSDVMEQLIIIGHGAYKIPAKEFIEEIKVTQDKISDLIIKYNRKAELNSKVTIGEILDMK